MNNHYATTPDGKRIHYIDMSQMSASDAERYLDNIKKLFNEKDSMSYIPLPKEQTMNDYQGYSGCYGYSPAPETITISKVEFERRIEKVCEDCRRLVIEEREKYESRLDEIDKTMKQGYEEAYQMILAERSKTQALRNKLKELKAKLAPPSAT